LPRYLVRLWSLAILFGAALLPASAQDAQNTGEPVYEAVDMANGADLIYARASAINLADYPTVPTSAGRMATIFQRGQSLGRNPHVLSKVGDCNSVEWLFLQPFGQGQYDLDRYAYLQDVVELFSDSFAYKTYAAYNGLNARAVLNPLWSNPAVCLEGESPLQCEYRLHNPSVAVIMFGSNDVLALTPAQFDQGLRRVVYETIQVGIIPVLSTFPRYIALPDRSILFNQIVVRVALDFNIPLMNLWLALEPLPSHGIDDDGYHLNGPLTRAADFSSERNLQTGYPLRNLITLQTLDVIRRDVMVTIEGEQPITR
jgi:hypothetical protein